MIYNNLQAIRRISFSYSKREEFGKKKFFEKEKWKN